MYLLIIFLPILTSIITGFFGNFLTKKGTTRIASGFIILTCILSYIVFYEVCFCLSPCYILQVLLNYIGISYLIV